MTTEHEISQIKVGDRVKSENGHFGRVVALETDEINQPHERATVRWDRGSKSYRPLEGLTKIVATHEVPMTKFRDTDAAASFIATADSRETSREVMEAIAFFARDEAEAIALWEGDGIDVVASLSDIWEHATGNGRIDADDLMWGGRSLAVVMSE